MRGASRTLLAVAAAVAVVAVAGTADAQPTSDAAAAEALFEDGRALMKRGDLAAACPKLRESHRLDPAPGTALALGACWERSGRVASAHAAFLSAVELARVEQDRERAAVAEERVAALAPRLPRVRVQLAAADARLPGLVVLCDDAPTSGPIEAPWALDPGRHVVEVRAPGKRPVRVAFDAEESRITDVPIPALAEAPSSTSPEDRAAPAGEPRGGWSATRTAGAIVAGAGLVTVAVGAVFGIEALSDAAALDDLGYDANRSTCPASSLARCTATYDDATSSGTTSSILLIGGGALVVGGITLVVLGGDDEPTTATLVVAPGPGTLHAAGRF